MYPCGNAQLQKMARGFSEYLESLTPGRSFDMAGTTTFYDGRFDDSGLAGHTGDAAGVASRVGQRKGAHGFLDAVPHAGVLLVDEDGADVDALSGSHSGRGALQVGDVVIFKTFFGDVFVFLIRAIGLGLAPEQKARQYLDPGRGHLVLFQEVNKTFGTAAEPGSFDKFFPKEDGAQQSDFTWAQFFRRPIGTMELYPRLTVREFYEKLNS